MKYMGSKRRIAKEILPIILKDRKPDQWYVEPFVGGCNMIDKVDGKRIANDLSSPLIAMWKALVYNKWKPAKYTKEEHKKVRLNKINYEPHVVGWIGFNCSYSGVFFGGYAGETKTKIGKTRDYQQEAINNTAKQIPKLKGVKFTNLKYDEIEMPPNSIIYCDPPYKNTSGYKNISDFNHDEFWQWCRDKAKEGHKIFISEYNAPDDFECVWQKEVKSSLSANGKSGGNKNSIEKLFIPKTN